MTKGILTIIDETEAQQLKLFTFHTGMDIPKWVRECPKAVAEKYFVQYRFLPKGKFDDVEEFVNFLAESLGAVSDNFFYGPAAAFWITASHPGTLMVVNDHYLEPFGKVDHSYELVIKDDRWILSGERWNEETDEQEPFVDVTYCDDFEDLLCDAFNEALKSGVLKKEELA